MNHKDQLWSLYLLISSYAPQNGTHFQTCTYVDIYKQQLFLSMLKYISHTYLNLQLTFSFIIITLKWEHINKWTSRIDFIHTNVFPLSVRLSLSTHFGADENTKVIF